MPITPTVRCLTFLRLAVSEAVSVTLKSLLLANELHLEIYAASAMCICCWAVSPSLLFHKVCIQELSYKTQSLWTSSKLITKVSAAVTTVIPGSAFLLLLLVVSFSLPFLSRTLCLVSSYFSENQMRFKTPRPREMLFLSANFCTRTGSTFSPFQSYKSNAKAGPQSNFTFGPYIVTREALSNLLGR
ncbi:Uncharacterized protein Fot_11144 [Forsythia ovata]|uniref:Uncharacterized protein n=1 Tax=Forsythia ovata TaxID=205694 RepID=A0ABD1WIV8_9LAMI